MLNLNEQSNSHDEIKLVQRDGQICVEKTFKNDLERAELNVKKQKEFKNVRINDRTIEAAPVISMKRYKNYSQLTMPYIDGITGSALPIHATRDQARFMDIALTNLIETQLDASKHVPVETSLINNKLNSVRALVGIKSLQNLLEQCERFLESFPDHLIFPIGPCHGDLTLSNIILTHSSKIVLIDFLTTFLETPLQDVAKLKQDFVYGWSFRTSTPPIKVKAEIFCRLSTPCGITKVEARYPKQVAILTMMSLARIAPYVKDVATQIWLEQNLEKFLRESRS